MIERGEFMEEIRSRLDFLYSQSKYQEGYQFLLEQLQQAMVQEDDLLVLGILSELMGYYRVHAMYELGNKMALRAANIITSRQLENTVMAGTTYLNIATLYRIQGMFQEANQYFLLCEAIYKQHLAANDLRVISFYNNYSLYYQSIGNTTKALEYGLQAYVLICSAPDSYEEQAISATNIATMYLQNKNRSKVKEYLDIAILLFEKHAPNDPHYFATLHTLAQYYTLEGLYEKAIKTYQEVLDNIENTYGRNSDYAIVYENYQYALDLQNQKTKGMELCKQYYQEVGKPVFEKKHPELMQYLAFGLIGMGSECLGFDDEISKDHDFGPGFMVFVPKEYFLNYGSLLQETYNQLPKEYLGLTRIQSNQGEGRVGVVCLEDYFLQFLGYLPKNEIDWFGYSSQSLLMLTKGAIFDDFYGLVTTQRKQLAYYPRDVRLKKIVRALSKMAQSGQYNYPRCKQRGDMVAMHLALDEFVKETMDCLCLLENSYTPYYKWTYQYVFKTLGLDSLAGLIKGLYEEDKDQEILIETICVQVVSKLQELGLSEQTDPFLQVHLEDVMSHIEDEKIKRMHVMEG